MNNLQYFFKISPETILNKYKDFIYTSANTVVTGTSRVCCSSSDITGDTISYTGKTRVQLSMKDILSGGTNGDSILTGLTLPILLTQTYIDLGFYTPFDGNITQKDVMNNFLFSSTTATPYTYRVYNTSDVSNKKYLDQAKWKINWGDGTEILTINNFTPNSTPHTYLISGRYTITLMLESPWGMYTVEKKINVPYDEIDPPNPNGQINFYPQGGIWDTIKSPYDYIFTGDSENSVQKQVSSNYTNVPFIITGFTKSRLTELATYGSQKYIPNQIIYYVSGNTIVNNKIKPILVELGKVLSITPNEIKYTINGINYSDFSDGTTIYIVESSGITSEMISSSAITKDETLIRIVDKPQVWSNVFIERGKNSALESIMRLGEVDNLGDLSKYGYKFFNLKNL